MRLGEDPSSDEEIVETPKRQGRPRRGASKQEPGAARKSKIHDKQQALQKRITPTRKKRDSSVSQPSSDQASAFVEEEDDNMEEGEVEQTESRDASNAELGESEQEELNSQEQGEDELSEQEQGEEEREEA